MRTLDRDFAIELKMYDGTMNYFSRQIETINRQIEDDRQFFTAEIRSAEENLKNVCLFLENQKKNYEKKFAELKKEADIFSQENRRELKKQSEKINGELSSGNQNRGSSKLSRFRIEQFFLLVFLVLFQPQKFCKNTPRNSKNERISSEKFRVFR